MLNKSQSAGLVASNTQYPQSAGGWLKLVPTPIGRMEDITLHALEVLRQCDRVLAEDTRTTGRLLAHHGIQQPLSSFHQHNEYKARDKWVEAIRGGAKLALVSDAGTPGLSDPGHSLLVGCLTASLPVEVLPGPTAFLPALLLSGLPNHRFAYEGFLPLKKGRQKRLRQLAEEERTMVFYESPHRIEKLLAELVEHLGPERRASLSREISKKFEETLRGRLDTLLETIQVQARKGEMVLTVEGKQR
jgi:16S rRNA (cytidine1402-2'-O)-methyltransferase